MLTFFYGYKNAAFIFDLLSNNLTRSKRIEKIEFFNGQTATARPVLGQKICTVISRSFLKKIFDLSYVKKKQFISKCLADRSNWFCYQMQIKVSSFITWNIRVLLTFKIFWFQNKQWVIETCHFFLLIWSTCSLVSAKRMLLLPLYLSKWNLIPFGVLRVKIWFSGFDTIRYHIFF